jgi:hypothetical protein
LLLLSNQGLTTTKHSPLLLLLLPLLLCRARILGCWLAFAAFACVAQNLNVVSI